VCSWSRTNVARRGQWAGFQIVEFNVLSNHIHLLVEAATTVERGSPLPESPFCQPVLGVVNRLDAVCEEPDVDHSACVVIEVDVEQFAIRRLQAEANAMPPIAPARQVNQRARIVLKLANTQSDLVVPALSIALDE
jgi:hypothetical protein